MGAVCCVAARDRTLRNRAANRYSNRQIRYSPSWSFRRDTRTHIEDIMDNNHVPFSRGHSLHFGKGVLGTEGQPLSDGGSPVENFQTPTWQKSPIRAETSGNSQIGAPDLTVGHNLSLEEGDFSEQSAVENTSTPTFPVSPSPTASCSSMSKAEPSSSLSYSPPCNQIQSSQVACCLQKYQLSRQASDSQVSAFKSPNNSLNEGRQSFTLPTSSNESALGSHGGSSDGWSMQMFSELVASQRERWSFDSENAYSVHGKITRSNSPSCTTPMDTQSCGMCSRLLTERSSWASQKIIANNELSVVAVLVCGHVYHAECLENATPEKDRYDPSCPVCTVGEKLSLKILSRKGLRADVDWKTRSKMSRIGVGDVDLDGYAASSDRQKGAERVGKGVPKMGASSSMKNSFGRPFLRRHFSTGSRTSHAPSEIDFTRKKGFWARYRRE